MHRSRIILMVVAAIAILSLGLGIAFVLVVTGPEAAKAKPETPVTGVEIHIVSFGAVPLDLPTQGAVLADRMTLLSSEVAGQVIEVAPAFESGGQIKQDGLLLRIDPADYRAAVAAADSQVALAEEQLALEKARAVQGRRDWERLGRGGEPDELVLRVPQLARAEATVASAKAGADKARRNLERTELRAPYDCQVRSKRVELGAVVAPGTMLGEIVSNEELEVRLPLSLKDYGFLETDESGRPKGAVKLFAEVGGETVEWDGQIVRSENEVERQTLSIYVVAGIEKNDEAPAGFAFPPVGLFVEASVTARPLTRVAALPRAATHDRVRDSAKVYVVEEGDVLGFREVKIRHNDREIAYVSEGLEAGDRVVATKIGAPVVGMQLKVLGAAGEVPVEAPAPDGKESAEN